MFASLRFNLIFVWLVSALFVLTQAFAAMHGVIHADGHLPAQPNGHAHHFEQADCEGHSHPSVAQGHSVTDLFSLHQHASDCRLFDQASHDGSLPTLAACLLPMVPPSFSVALFQGKALARWAALFDARGPPLTV